MAHLMITTTSKTGRQALPVSLIGLARGLHSLRSFDGSVWGLKDQFALANPEVKFLSADVRFQVQNRVSAKENEPPTFKQYKN